MKTFKNKLAVALIALITFVAPYQSAQAESSESFYKTFVNGIASMVYSAAWPTAQYRGFTLSNVTPTNNGAKVAFRLYGLSGWDYSSLWTDVELKITNGNITDVSWGANNALVMQPGVTMAALGVLMVELTKEYQNSSPNNQPAPSTVVSGVAPPRHKDYWLTCLVNNSNISVPYSYKWRGDNEWKPITLKPGHTMTHSITANKAFEIRYDNSLQSGMQMYKTTAKTKYSRNTKCSSAKKYAFSMNGNALRLGNI